MIGIKKFFFGRVGALMLVSLLAPFSSFAMEENKEDLNKSLNKSIIKQESPRRYTEEELKKLFEEQRDAMKRANKSSNKYLKIKNPKKIKNYK